MSWLTAPFAYPFMLDAFLIVAIIAVPAALLSCFLVLKGWSLMGDAVSHAVLPGVVAAYAAGLPLLVGAFAAGLICALGTGFVQGNSRVKQDTVLGVIMSGMFGLGVVMFTAVDSNLHLDHVLFGNLLGTDRADILTAAGIALPVALAIGVWWRDLALAAFDPVQARVSGLRTGWLHYGLLTGLSAMVVAMLSAVGIILSVSLLIAPGAIAFLLTRRLGAMLWTAAGVALGACLLGVWLSFHVDAAPAPTIVLTLTAGFVAAFLRRLLRVRRLSAGDVGRAEGGSVGPEGLEPPTKAL